MKSEMELVPCPFCGGKADPAGWLDGKGNRGPECEGCGATAPSVDVWQAAHQQAVPSRYVMVPVEPTMEMLGAVSCWDHVQQKAKEDYRAMIAAAPQAERVLWYRGREEPQAEQQIVGWINEDELPENYPYDAMFPFSKVDMVRMFPVFAPVAQAEQADEYMPEGLIDDLMNSQELDCVGMAADALRTPQAEQAVEPVAWQFYQDGAWHNGDDRIKDHKANTIAGGYPVRDLFTAPPAPDVSGLEQVVCTLQSVRGFLTDMKEKRSPSKNHDCDNSYDRANIGHASRGAAYYLPAIREALVVVSDLHDALATHRSNSHE